MPCGSHSSTCSSGGNRNSLPPRLLSYLPPCTAPTSSCPPPMAGRSVCAGSRNTQASRNNDYNNFESNYQILCDSFRNVVQTQPPPESRIKYLGPLWAQN